MRTLLAIGVVLWGTFSFAADERLAIQNEFLRVTADGGAGEFSIQALPSQTTIIRAGRLSGSDGRRRNGPSMMQLSARRSNSLGGRKSHCFRNCRLRW